MDDFKISSPSTSHENPQFEHENRGIIRFKLSNLKHKFHVWE